MVGKQRQPVKGTLGTQFPSFLLQKAELLILKVTLKEGSMSPGHLHGHAHMPRISKAFCSLPKAPFPPLPFWALMVMGLMGMKVPRAAALCVCQVSRGSLCV